MMQMQADFPIGSLDPYTLLLATGVPGGALTPAYFAAENALIQRLIVSQSPAGFVDAQSVSGLSYFGGANVSFSMYLAMANASSPQAASPVGVAYRTTVLPGISADASAALVTVQTLTDPDGSAMVPFIVAVRALLNSCATPALPNLAGYLVGGYSSTLDVQDSLYRLVPAEIGAIVALVLLIIGTSFGSAAIAVRLVITVIISLCWTYGLMVLVYQPGAAQDAFAVISPTLRSSVGLYWIIPIMSFSILVG